MNLLFRILKSSFTDKLAYVSAVAGALSWLIHAWYPAILPGQLRATAHIYMTIMASLAAGMMIAKYVLMEGFLRSTKDLITDNEAFAATIQRLEGTMLKIREDRDRISERESVLKNKLKSFENSETEAQLSSLRKKIRLGDEDRKTCLSFLVHELRNRLQELENINDQEIIRAAAVLKKEIQMVEDEIKKGTVSLYELVLKINEIREYTHDLAIIRLQSGDGQGENVRDHRQPRDFPWFDTDADPSKIDRIYKFLKVAFHPDRFSSEGLKKEATTYFQETVRAYSTLKERIRSTH
jgi:curved DNA-binding protein CbpA